MVVGLNGLVEDFDGVKVGWIFGGDGRMWFEGFFVDVGWGGWGMLGL